MAASQRTDPRSSAALVVALGATAVASALSEAAGYLSGGLLLLAALRALSGVLGARAAMRDPDAPPDDARGADARPPA